MVRRAFPAKVVVGLVLAFLVVGGVMVAGAVLRDDDSSTASTADQTTSTSAEPTTTTTTLPPTTTTTTLPRTIVQPVAQSLPELPVGGIGNGSIGPLVGAYQQRLHDLKLDPGPVDGTYGQEMTYAVEAIQKMAGLPTTGRIDYAERVTLENFQYNAPIHPDAEPNRTEIDIARQVITLYQNYQPLLITTTSTASGETFCYVTPKKAPTQRVCEVATTPNGRFAYYYFYDGWQDGDLGSLYNPYYFFKGRAIHGYDSVPTHPASHGCSRIPMHIATYWHTLVHDGEPVYVDGGPANGEEIISSQSI
jgi:peptidoglycan hydrolase-like protein with peptidoglycan-binding domain